MRTKILYLITKSNWGGAQRYVYDLASRVPSGQFDVRVALGGDGLLKKKLEEIGIPTIPIQGLERDISFTKELSAFGNILKILRDKPDILHVNSSKAGGLGALAGRIVGVKKIIFTAHGWPFWERRDPLSRLAIYFFSWITAILAHKVIVISDYDLKVAQKMPFIAHKAVRIYNGIDLNFLLYPAHRIRDAFPEGARITGTIGELNKNKNQIALIEQARSNSALYVAIVGEGENRPYLKRKIEEYGLEAKVKLFGFIPANEVLKGFDVFALPSIKEGLPYVLLEARAAGLPIVANRVGGVGEILDAKDMNEFSLERMLEKTMQVYFE
jgi:glycosyltransferase involved in cell wall biosynthesis